MAHKNLLSDRKIWEQAQIPLHRKDKKCWAMKKVRFDKIGVKNAKRNEKAVAGITLYSYKCPVCKYYHLTKEKQ